MKKFIILLLWVLMSNAQALEFTVNTTEDTVDVNVIDGLCEDINGNCSLRAAIMQTNSFATDDVIYLPRNEIYLLSLSVIGADNERVNDLDIRDTLTLSIAQPELPITTFEERPLIVGNGMLNDRVFDIQSGQSITFFGIGITGGNADSSAVNARRGGGIYVSDQVAEFSLKSSFVTLNQAGFGAGVYSAAASTRIESSDISYNVLIFPALITSGAGGAGIYHVGDSMTIKASSLHHNFTNEENGFLVSALTLRGTDSAVNILNTLISDNGHLIDTTLSTIDGISANQVDVYINNSNITRNTRYGMRFSSIDDHLLTIRNSVLAYNTVNNCGILEGINDFGSASNPAHIASSDLSCELPELAFNHENINPKISPTIGKFMVSDYSFFITQYPLGGSVLIDSGKTFGLKSGITGACENVDIRGVSRPVNGGYYDVCDIGVYELDDVIFVNNFSIDEVLD